MECVNIDGHMLSVFDSCFFSSITLMVLGFVGVLLICCTKKKWFSPRLKILPTYEDPTCVFFFYQLVGTS